MLETSDEDDPNWRDKYRNPSPPPGYIRPKRKKEKTSEIFKMIEDMSDLSIYVEIFDNPNIEDFVPESSEDGELLSEDDSKKKIKYIKQSERIDKSCDDHFSKKKMKYKKRKYRLESQYLSSEGEYSDSFRRKHSSRSRKKKHSGPMFSSSEDDHSLMLTKQKEMICKDESKKSNFSLKYKIEKYPESRYPSSEEEYSISSGIKRSEKLIKRNSQSMSSSFRDDHSKSQALGSRKRHSTRIESYESNYDSKRSSRKRRNSWSMSSPSKNYSYSSSPNRIESYKYDYDSKRSIRSKSDNNDDYYYDNFISEKKDEFCVATGGSYYCKLCKTKMNSKQMLYNHKYGKKHLKINKSRYPVDEHKSKSCHIQHDKQGGSNREGTVASCIYIPGDFSAKFEKAKEPDTSMSDFYCRLCDAHMNSKDDWDKHISGNRHIKNLKKAPGEIPSKAKSLKIPGANSKLMRELKTVDGPIIGLKVIRETQNPLIKSVLYNCYVCRSNMTEIDIIKHITSRKHKTAYLQNIENRSYDLLKKTGINEKHLEETINDICYEVIEKEGSGRPEVYVLKNAISTHEKY